MIIRPTLLLDQKKCLTNIQFMANKAQRLKVALRPHFKTHQSHEIGRWFKNTGVDKITTSSMKMADYFSRDGWNDITVAFPVNILEIDLINELANNIQLNLVLESVDSAQYLINNLLAQVNYFIKVDPGYGRTGVSWNDYEKLKKLIKISQDSYALNFKGFLSHFGHTYYGRSTEEIEDIYKKCLDRLQQTRENFINDYPDLILSIGDTPGCSVVENFGVADEIRPGNYVFYDLTQFTIGSCKQDQIATAMACPVVAIHKERNELIIHGGSIHFSTDRITKQDGTTIFGQVVEEKSGGWGKLIDGAYISKLSQEHGTVIIPPGLIHTYKVGDIITFVAVHSCTNSNLMKEYKTFEGRSIDHMEGVFK
jgi:D-serine deaminase-like pyridoxal phosphate-dependent protein